MVRGLSLAKPLKKLRFITQPHQPILLTIIAEEVKKGLYEPDALSSTVQLALIMGELDNSPPYFDHDYYIARMDENSPQGTALLFNDPYLAEIRDDDLGKNGVFSISLRNNNGTFEISPTVGETRANFVVRVRNNSLLDYEKRHVLTFTIVAQEVGPKTSLSSSAQVTVYLNDANDNPPVFRESVYRVDLKENVTEGTKVVQVAADDIDEGENAEIAYIGIERDNNSLQIDSTGWISVRVNKHIFDREVAKEWVDYNKDNESEKDDDEENESGKDDDEDNEKNESGKNDENNESGYSDEDNESGEDNDEDNEGGKDNDEDDEVVWAYRTNGSDK
ncbi:hypothetical protein ANN_11804 [Periplaneta americana]|uniref:Cadherin domain-containing protein n=1 Tax=Periplaneta americana TaxID=6978 RepID=A0ABQ8T631_PERAM|nr:hypothetical protein ANN_11804 [Periplaneta americana]